MHDSYSFSFSLGYTSKGFAIYAIVLEWPLTDELILGTPISVNSTQVTMLGCEGKFVWKPATDKDRRNDCHHAWYPCEQAAISVGLGSKTSKRNIAVITSTKV